MTRFATGRVCQKHPELCGRRYATSRNCPACSTEWRRALPTEKKSRRNAQTREWYAANRTTVLAKMKAKAEENRPRRQAYHAKRYAEVGDRLRANARWGSKRKKFGLTKLAFEALLKSQGGGCAICGQVLLDSRGCVDHCHVSGDIRGILCSPCNKALGFFRDDIARMSKAIKYLLEAPND